MSEKISLDSSEYKDSIFSAKTDNIRSKFYEIIHVESTSVAESP